MLRPTDIEALKGSKNSYEVVVGVAKRARDIADAAEHDGVVLIEKPVSMAIADLRSGEYKIMAKDKDIEE